MHDIYLYEGTDVLKNLLNIKDRELLDEAEADYVTYRLKEVAINPLPGKYDYAHLLQIFIKKSLYWEVCLLTIPTCLISRKMQNIF